MNATNFLILLGLSLLALGSAVASLLASSSSDPLHPVYITVAVLAGVLVYCVLCVGSITFWKYRMAEMSLKATREEEMERNNEIHRMDSLNASTTASSAPPHRRQDLGSLTGSHAGPLTSNPPNGPPSDLSCFPPSLTTLHTATAVSIKSVKAQSIQIPARTTPPRTSPARTDSARPSPPLIRLRSDTHTRHLAMINESKKRDRAASIEFIKKKTPGREATTLARHEESMARGRAATIPASPPAPPAEKNGEGFKFFED